MDRWLESQQQPADDGKLAGKEAVDGSKRTTAERREELVRILLGEPFAQGAEAAVHEADLLSSPDWGFKFEDVEYNPVRIWHGAEDKNAPVVMIRYLAERLPHCIMREYAGDTHYTMFNHVDEVLSELVPE